MSDNNEIARALAEAIVQAANYANRDANEYSKSTIKNTKISGNQIRQNSIPGFMLSDGSVPTAKIRELTVEVARIAIAEIAAADIEFAQIKNVVIDNAHIGTAGIDYAKIKDLDAESAYFGSQIFELGLGDSLYMGRLRVNAANIAHLEVGELILEDEEGDLYKIGIDDEGNVITTLYEVQYQNIATTTKNLMSQYTVYRGESAPSTPYVGQLWVNTTTDIISRCTAITPVEIWEPVKANELHTSFINAVEKGLEILSTGVIDIKNGGSININSGGDINVDNMGNINVESGGNIDIGSGGTFTVASENFNIDASGNVVAKGVIEAHTGKFGGENGFTVAANKMYSGSKSGIDDANIGVYIGTDGVGLGANSPFMVTDNGALTATGVDIEGDIKALSGAIGAGTNKWIISADGTNAAIHTSGKTALTDNAAGVYVGVDGIAMGVNSPFKVTSDGALAATNADITGVINATSGTIGNTTKKWNISSSGTEGAIYNGKDSLDSTAAGVYVGTDGISLGGEGVAPPFRVAADGSVTASKLRLNNYNLTEITNANSQHFVAQAQHDASPGVDNFPAVFDFYIPDTAAKVVEVGFTFKLEPYRADSKSISGGTGDAVITGVTGIQIVVGSDHSHNVDGYAEVEGHVHPIVFGIYENTTLPTSVTLEIDGVDKTAILNGTTHLEDYDIIGLLTADVDGLVAKGWHSVSVYVPAGFMVRVVAHLYSTVIIGTALQGGDLAQGLVDSNGDTMSDNTGLILTVARIAFTSAQVDEAIANIAALEAGTITAAAARNALGLGNTSGALPVANGGTGATTAVDARTNLGVAATSHGAHVPMPEAADDAKYLRNDNSWQTISPADIAAAAATHEHNASAITVGALTVPRGGTGLATVEANSYLKGNGTNNLVPRTYAEVLSDIGAAAAAHSQAVANGGTGLPTVAAGSYLKGNDANNLVPRTPAEVLADIAALPLAGGTLSGHLKTPSLSIQGNGTYEAGSIYSDSSWGMLFRAKQASPQVAQYRWAKSDDAEVMRIDLNDNLGIGGIPNANAILDAASTTKAFMPPRMTTTQRDAISSATEGMVIYNLTTHVLDFHNGAAWGAV